MRASTYFLFLDLFSTTTLAQDISDRTLSSSIFIVRAVKHFAAHFDDIGQVLDQDGFDTRIEF